MPATIWRDNHQTKRSQITILIAAYCSSRLSRYILAYDQRRSASRVWVRLGEDDLARLDGSSPLAPHLPTFGEVMRAECLSHDALWDRVRHGGYLAFRTQHGRCWEWRLQRAPAPDVGRDNQEPDHHA